MEKRTEMIKKIMNYAIGGQAFIQKLNGTYDNIDNVEKASFTGSSISLETKSVRYVCQI